MISPRRLQERLEAEYPLLDTSLLAALILDLPSPIDPSHETFQNLHHMLSKFSLEASMQQQAESNARIHHHKASHTSHLETEGLRRSENSGKSPDDLSLSTSGMSSSSACGSSTTSMTSTLEFLHILFPRLPVKLIQQALCVHEDALHSADVAPDETDISDVVDHLLTQEYIQDLVERGLEATSDAESDSGVWITVAKKGRHSAGPKKSKSHSRPRSMPLVDTRQRQHVLTDPAAKAATRRSLSLSADPWTRLTSLAMRLSELLQPIPAGFFMSYFHRPAMNASGIRHGWKAEGDALRDALADLVTRSAAPVDKNEVESKILLLHEILQNPDTNDFPILDAEEQSKLTSDMKLCVAVARGDSATALDLVWLLRELDEAFDQGDGVAHSLVVPVADRPAPSVLESSSRPATAAWAASASSAHVNLPAFARPIQPPPIPPPPLSRKHPPLTPTSRKDRGWTIVEPRRPKLNKCALPHAEFIPAYSKRSTRMRYGPGSQFGRDDVGELGPQARNIDWYKARVSELQSQRNEALREARRHWQRGNVKSHGGEIALYYAEKARELQEQRKQRALSAARLMVEEKRATCTEHNTLDLHGLTVIEACVIVKEAIEASPPSLAHPLKIITGRGRHSVGHIGVLGPAVREMLRAEGWHVKKRDGELIVREKS